jgi:hypothetical protein
MLDFNLTPFLDFRWWFDVIESFPVKIFYAFTLRTSQVLVRGQIRIKPGLVIKGRYSGNETAILKGQECSVNRVQRNSRNSTLDPLIDGICGRMIVRRGQLSKDFKALVRKFKAFAPATILKGS